MANANRTFRSSMMLSTALAAMVAMPGVAHAQLVRAGDLIDAIDDGGNPGQLTVTDTSATRTDMRVLAPVVVANWNRFNVPLNNSVVIANGTANPTATLVNRVIGPNPSSILGSIDAPDINLWLINQNGILFGGDGTVTSASFFASTLDVSDADLFDFYNGTDLAGNGSGTLNFGGSLGNNIRTGGPGYNFITDGSVMFVSEQLTLNTDIDAGSGTVSFVTAADVDVSFTPGSPLSYVVNAGTTIARGQSVSGTVRGDSVDFHMVTDTGVVDAVLRVNALVTATGATATSNGIRLFADSPDAAVDVFINGAWVSSDTVSIVTDGDLRATATLTGTAIDAAAEGTLFVSDLNATEGGIDLASASSTLTAGNLTATGGDITLLAPGNITTGNLTASPFRGTGGGIDVESTGGRLTLGVLDADTDIALDAFGRITTGAIRAGGDLDVGMASAPEAVRFNGDVIAAAVRIDTIGAFNAMGLTARSGDLSVDALSIAAGAVRANQGSVDLLATGAITTASITADAQDLTGGTLSVRSLGGGALNLGNLASGGDMTLATTGSIIAGSAIARDGALLVGGMAAANNVTFNGNISAASVTIDALGAFRGQDVTATAGGVDIDADLIATGNIRATGGDVLLDSVRAVTAGNITATTVAGVGGAIDIDSVNGAVTLGNLSGGADITLDTTRSIQAGSVTTTGGTLTVGAGAVPTSVTFTGNASAQSITIDTTGAFAGGALTATAGSVDVDALTITAGAVRATGGDVLLAAPGAITTGNVTATTVAGTGGAIDIESVNGNLTLGNLSGGAAIALDTSGAISAGGVTAGGALSVGGGSDPASVTFSGNVVAQSITVDTLGAFQSAGLTATAGGVTIDATTITAGDIRATGDAVVLTASGAITTGNVTANGAAITIASSGGGALSLGNLAADGAIALDTTGSLTAGSALARGGALTVGGMLVPSSVTFTGNIAGDSVSVLTTGAFDGRSVTANAGGISIDAATISALALSATGGDVDLAAVGNIGTGAITASGAITAITSGAGSNLTLDNLAAGLGITLDADSAIATGRITASGGPLAVGLGASADSVTFGGDASAQSITILTTGAFNGAGLTATAGGVSVDAASITAGAIAATGGDVDLLAPGAIATGNITALASMGMGGAIDVESTGGGLTLGILDADGAITLDAIDAITTGAITARGGALEVGLSSGPTSVTFGGNATAQSISVLGGDLFSGQALTATAGSVTIEAGAISAGAITAMGGDVDLNAFQDIGTGAIAASGAITVQSNAADGNLALGALTAGLDITLDAGGMITTSGPVTSTGGALIVGLGSSVDSVTFGGNAAAQSITVLTTGAFEGAGLAATAGDVSVNAASIAAAAVSATGGDVSLIAEGDITTAAIGATGSILVDSTGADGDLTLGNLSAGLGITLDAEGAIRAGTATATGGALLAGLGSSADSITFGGAVSAVAIELRSTGEVLAGERDGDGVLVRRTNMTATGGSLVIDAGAITTGALAATGGNVDLSATGDIDTLGITASGLMDVDSTGMGGDLRLGALSAGQTIDLSADGDIVTGAIDAVGALTVGEGPSADSVTFGGTVSARSISVRSAGEVLAGERDPARRTNLIATGGDVGIIADSITTGSITATGGNVVLRGTGNVDTIGLTALRVAGVGGTVDSRSTAGALNHGVISADGLVNLLAAGTIDTGAITARDGAVTVEGSAITITGATSATGGDVRLTALGNITTGDITAVEAGGSGGAIEILSTGTGASAGALTLGTLDAARLVNLTAGGAIATRAITARRGSITANGDSIAITGTATATGGDVLLTALRNITATGAISAIRSGNLGGAIDIQSTGTGANAGILNLAALLADLGIELDAGGAISTGAITARNGAVDVNGLAITINGATSATGGDVVLLATNAITTGAITTNRAIDIDSTGGGALTLGALDAGRGITLDTTGAVATGAVTAVNDVVVGGTRIASDVTFGGPLQAANLRVEATGLVTANAVAVGAGAVDIEAANAELLGAVNAGSVLLKSRSNGSIGLGSAAGTMSLTDAELDRISTGSLVIDAGSGAIGIAGVSFRDQTGSNTVTLATTGTIAITGDLSGTGAARTFRLGGAADGSGVASRITANIDAATIDLGTASLDLRGENIVFGQQALIDQVAGLSLDRQVKELIGNAESLLYTPQNLSAARLANPTYLIAGKMTVTYGGSALFQNSAPRDGGNAFEGVQLGGMGAPAGAPLVLNPLRAGVLQNFSVQDGNVFALFGSLNGFTGPAAALGGDSLISVNDRLLAPASRVNGCIIGSGEGCVTTIVGNFVLNLPRQVIEPIVAEEGDRVPFDPLVGTNNEGLFSDAATAPKDDKDCEQRDANGVCVIK
ncbi:filamentous hemagglutinin N-terminal domain-containing protein [Porphyrobacter sp. YT40]|uniref:two-partner secretion domain-containing protein n=1 Tax=Porphyrobacter sp. YT40 TaxID=2547601 RepID=UPI001142EF22|nr:filamentous hemagglutinin N-terminal domain-containing protein [Porphyrobacter sp. YT40]QDH33056.1 filamentous hemagglutinin N-terminal domain-containing protein [Porphyrobacter sp. YT40]